MVDEQLPERQDGDGPEELGARGQIRSELAVVHRGTKQRWGIPDKCREAAITAAWEIVENPKSRPREKTAAMRCLAAFDALNLEQERRDQNISDKLEITVRDEKDQQLAEFLDAKRKSEMRKRLAQVMYDADSDGSN
jgi:hypothetical protein